MAIVTNLNALGPVPTGTVTFQDITYQGTTRITNVLDTNVSLLNGVAFITNSSLIASTNSFGNHFVTAIYNGDANFPSGTATLIQKVHASATTVTLVSAISSATNVTL